jgi:hypothetical protein
MQFPVSLWSIIPACAMRYGMRRFTFDALMLQKQLKGPQGLVVKRKKVHVAYESNNKSRENMTQNIQLWK